MASNNPYMPGDRVTFPRGPGRLSGSIVKTILNRCHIEEDASGKVFVEDYHNVERAPARATEAIPDPHRCRLCEADGPHGHDCEGVTYEYPPRYDEDHGALL